MNKQHGQWGTEYNSNLDLGTHGLTVETANAPVDEFTVSILPAGARKGTLVLEWGTFKWSAPIVVI